MGKPIEIKIVNLPQIQRAFNKAPTIMRFSLQQALAVTIRVVEEDEELQYANLGIGVITGGLLTSIRQGFYLNQQALKAEVGPNVTNNPGVPYAVFVHDGTRYMRSRPFLRDAVKSAQPEIDRIFTKAVDDTLHTIGKMT